MHTQKSFFPLQVESAIFQKHAQERMASHKQAYVKEINWKPSSAQQWKDQKAPIQMESNENPDKSPYRGTGDEPSEQQAECMYSLFSCLRANVFFIHSKIGLISPQTPRHKLNPPANHSTSQKIGRDGGREGWKRKKKANSSESKCELGLRN